MTWWPCGSSEVMICPAAVWHPGVWNVNKTFLKGQKKSVEINKNHHPRFLSPCLSPVTDHELCGSVGGPGVCAGQGAVQRTQPCDAVWMYRCHRGPAARWLPAVLPLPRPLRQDGCAAVTWESGEIIERPYLWLSFSLFICMYRILCVQVIWEFKSVVEHWSIGSIQVFYLSKSSNIKTLLQVKDVHSGNFFLLTKPKVTELCQHKNSEWRLMRFKTC